MIAKAALQRLKDAPWLRDPATQKIFALLDGEKGKTRAVGGAIRDTLVDHEREASIAFATPSSLAASSRRSRASSNRLRRNATEHGHSGFDVTPASHALAVRIMRPRFEHDARAARYGARCPCSRCPRLALRRQPFSTIPAPG